MTLGAVRYAVSRAPPPRGCPCRCCSGELVAACVGRAPERRTLDRLERLQRRWVRARDDRPSRHQRLQALTEKLLPRATATAAVPPAPPAPPPRLRHRRSPPRLDRGLSTDRASCVEAHDFDADDIALVRVEPRAIVGSYAQKTIPYRSASFSQGDFAPEKYYRGVSVRQVAEFARRTPLGGAILERRDAESSSLATEETVTEGGSVASVDSAVGSDEALPARSSPAPDPPHKQLGTRSLTHPLPRSTPRGPGETSAPGGSLPVLVPPRVLHELREESDGSQADSAQPTSEGASPVEVARPFAFPPLPEPPRLPAPATCANADCGCAAYPVLREDSASALPVPVYECIVKQWSEEQLVPSDREKEDETITSEQVADLLAAVQNSRSPSAAGLREKRRTLDKTKRRKGIYITTASDEGGEDESSRGGGSTPETRLSAEGRTPSLLGDKSDDSCADGPPSPCEIGPPLWPRSEPELRARRARFSQQSSDERDEDSYIARRRCGVTSRADSPSEGESETSRDRTASPSPFGPDGSDAETRQRRLARAPFGRTLETPSVRAADGGRRSFSDATVPARKSSAGAVPVEVRGRGPTHVRATSSPSKLAGVRAGADLLAELLRGSSEALSNSTNFDNVVLTLHQHNVSTYISDIVTRYSITL